MNPACIYADIHSPFFKVVASYKMLQPKNLPCNKRSVHIGQVLQRRNTLSLELDLIIVQFAHTHIHNAASLQKLSWTKKIGQQLFYPWTYMRQAQINTAIEKRAARSAFITAAIGCVLLFSKKRLYIAPSFSIAARRVENIAYLFNSIQPKSKGMSSAYALFCCNVSQKESQLAPSLCVVSVDTVNAIIKKSISRSRNLDQIITEIVRRTWDRGSFGHEMSSVKYHLKKHGQGRSIVEYTKDALLFFEKNKSVAQQRILTNGQNGYYIRIKSHKKCRGGFWTKEGKIITFWD